MADVVVGLAELVLSREPPAEVGELWSCVLGIVETLISSGSGWLNLTLLLVMWDSSDFLLRPGIVGLSPIYLIPPSPPNSSPIRFEGE